MSKPRPGVEAGKRLFNCNDVKVWQLVEAQEDHLILEHVKSLKDVDQQYRELGGRLKSHSMKCITKEELLLVVKWKFLVGKPRPALMKHLHSNSEESVKEHSTAAFEIARSFPENTDETTEDLETTNDSIKDALEALMNLKGVGPATASAILTLVRPDVVGYMYDESIESCGLKRAYNLTTYLKLNQHCTQIAAKLGHDWTPCRVARAMWTASRAQAYGFQDVSTTKMSLSKSKHQTRDDGKEHNPKKRRVG
jgi:hypothetical protein